MPDFQFVYFDLDDTLLDHGHAERLALADVCAHFDDRFGAFDVAHVQRTYHVHNVELWGRYAQGSLRKEELKIQRFARLLEALGLDAPTAGTLHDHYMERYAAHWHFPDEARRAFQTIADRLPVGLLTNGFAEVQHAKLERFPELKEQSQALIISEEVGAMKPHRRIFEHATEAAGVPAEAILYVGDSYRSDVRGGRAAGWHVAWYAGIRDAVDGDDGVFCFDNWDALLAWLGIA